MEERDIDEYAEARANKNILTLSQEPQTWVNSLMQKGYSTPFIKQLSDDGNQMWFVQDGIDYVAQLNGNGVVHVEKAKPDPGVHTPFNPGYKDYANYNPTGHHRQHRDYSEDEEEL